jgi:hypothetical protein
MRQLIFIGEFKSEKLDPLEECQPIIESEQGYWVPHHKFNFVPQFKMQNHGLVKELRGLFYWVNESFRNATKNNLFLANFEDNKDK